MTTIALNRPRLALVVCLGFLATLVLPPAHATPAPFRIAGGSTTLTLAATPSPVLAGGTVTLNAMVSNDSATGLVHYINVTDALEMGSATLVNGVAAFTRGPLSPGDFTFQAHYDGDPLFSPSTSPQVLLHVGDTNPTSVDILAAHGFALQGTLDTLLMNVTPANAGGTFMLVSPGNGYSGPWNVTPINGAGQVVLSLNGSPGLIPFRVHFTGNPFFYASDDTAMVQVFGPSATTVVSMTQLHPKAGDVVNFHARISAPSPSGNVSFYIDNAFVGVASVTAGVATYSTSALSIGTHTVYAAWSGENSKASAPFTVRVTGATLTQLALAIVPSPGVIRTSSTFSVKALMTPAQVGGSVSMMNAAGQTGTIPLVAGVATAGGQLYAAPGFYTYRASFAGDDVYAFSSDSTTVEVDAPTSQLLLFSDVNPSAVG